MKRAGRARGRMVVERPDQLAALTSPVRLELLEQFGLRGPCAVADVAGHMGRRPAGLYYHVRRLLEVGLLEEVERRRTSHRFESVYRVPAEEILLTRKPRRRSARQSTLKAANAVLRLAGRELGAALEDDAVSDEGPERTLYARRSKARLSRKALRELNRHLSSIENIFEAAARRQLCTDRTVAVTIVVTPTTVHEGS